MYDTDKVFSGSIPEFYDTCMVPLIFEDFARDLAARVHRLGPLTILETAAGSGVVARALAPLLRPEVRYTATDLNQPMLDRAAQQQPSPDRIRWQQADALYLPFANGAFDVVCCQFGAMFFADKVAGYREARRVLRPGGHFLFNVWDAIAHNEFADVVTQTCARVFPDDPPVFLARTPHGYHDLSQITEHLRAAGFGRIETQTIEAQSRAATPRDAAVAYCQGTLLRGEIEARDPDGLARVTDLAAQALAVRFGPGPVSGKTRAHVIIASA